MSYPGCHQPDLVNRSLGSEQPSGQKCRSGESPDLEGRQEAGGAELHVEFGRDLGYQERSGGERQSDGPSRGEDSR